MSFKIIEREEKGGEWNGRGWGGTFVELHGCGAFEGKAHAGECVRESLHSNADRAVAEVRVLRLS